MFGPYYYGPYFPFVGCPILDIGLASGSSNIPKRKIACCVVQQAGDNIFDNPVRTIR